MLATLLPIIAVVFDLALGLANPALGLVASGAGLRGVYFVSTLVVLCAAAIAARLLNAPSLDMASRVKIMCNQRS